MTATPKKPASALARTLFAKPVAGEEIEARSLAAVDELAPAHGLRPEEWAVLRRMIHATADFSLVGETRFTPGAVESGMAALRAGAPIYVDSNMIRAGLSLARLGAVSPKYGSDKLLCHVADADVAAESRAGGLPRSLYAVRKAGKSLDGAIVAFGNAPVGLLELNRLVIEEGLRPALIIAMPVGFVHVVESKDEALSLGVPCIAVSGRRGGSTLAVSAIHALCELALGRGLSTRKTARKGPERADAVILLGHGSRVPDASQGMERVCAALKSTGEFGFVDFCHMSQLGPNFPEVFARAVKAGARKVLVMPYFLHFGQHMRADIPEILRAEATKAPGVSVVLGRHLGYDDVLVDLVRRRMGESLALPDVRELKPVEERG